jgi:hypothetical protein
LFVFVCLFDFNQFLFLFAQKNEKNFIEIDDSSGKKLGMKIIGRFNGIENN